jgi:hypothetical protein
MHQLEDVRPLERISSGKDEDRGIQLSNVVDQLFGFLGAEFQRVSPGLGTRAAMKARQIAGAGGLPDHYQWSAVKIKIRPHAVKRKRSSHSGAVMAITRPSDQMGEGAVLWHLGRFMNFFFVLLWQADYG